MEHFDVFVAGFEVSEERAIRGLMQVFGLSESAARNFLRSVPRMGKRRQPQDAAQRYAQVLRSVGAVVECRPSRATVPPSAADAASRALTSLPAPASLPSSSASPTGAADTLQIPRAPRVPSELVDAQGSDWLLTDETASNRLLTGLAATKPLPGVDDARNAGVLRPADSGPTPELAQVAHGSRSAMSVRPANAEIMGVAYVSARPSLPAPMSTRRGWGLQLSRAQVLALCCVFAAVGYIGHQHHWLQTEPSVREAQWHAEGIDCGDYDDATHYLTQAGDQLEGVATPRLQTMLDTLQRAGAPQVWVIGITKVAGHRSASTLLIQLPQGAQQRQTLFFQDLPTLTRRPPPDTGQRYLKLDLRGSS